MNARPKLLIAAIALAAAPALAAEVIVYTPAATTTATTTEVYQLPSTSCYYYPNTTTYYYTPSLVEIYESPNTITVEAPRVTEDQAITNEVVDRLATNPRLSGKIGVETYARNVELTGVVNTRRQVELAEQDARGVAGVERVTNDIRPRLGH